MCGIAGFLSTRTSTTERELTVDRMCSAMHHRGPDDGGRISRGPITLGMRRLAIFDPANGHQPWQSDDGRYTLVFNGALLNFRELRTELEQLGRPFRTECDTEVLLAALTHWGTLCLNRLRGMFAFALWDDHVQSLWLARDPLGVKPLYFRPSESSGDFVFASELRALQKAGGDFTIDPEALADTLAFLAVPSPRTLYRGIFSLGAGESLRWKGGRLEKAFYWDFSLRSRNERPCTDVREFTHELRARLQDSVRYHLIADVPVGLFLSGGLDSAVLAGLATQSGSHPIRTFSIGFDEAGYSEAEEAAATARHFGCEHRAAVITGPRVAADLDRLLGAMDQPTGDALNVYYASETAQAGGVRVVLSGLGSDELFGGYGYFEKLLKLHRYQRSWRWAPRPFRRGLAGLLCRGSSRTQKVADLFAEANTLNELAACSRRVWSTSAVRDLTDGRAGSASHPALKRLSATLADADPFETLSAWELQTYMADVLLRDGDTMSMRHSLELRVPFVDRPMIEWLWRQPSAWRHTPEKPKSALAAAMSDLLPPGMAGRPKRGFALPMDRWIRRDLRPFMEDTFAAPSVGRSGFFSVREVQARWKHFLSHEDERSWSRLWSLAVTIAFLNRRASR